MRFKVRASPANYTNISGNSGFNTPDLGVPLEFFVNKKAEVLSGEFSCQGLAVDRDWYIRLIMRVRKNLVSGFFGVNGEPVAV